MVLSLNEIRKVHKKAIDKSKSRYNGKIKGESCIVIDLKFESDSYNSGDGAKQVGINRVH